MEMLEGEVVAVAGNHDCSERALCDNDTLAILCGAGKVRLLEATGRWQGEPWSGFMNGAAVAIGGTNWGGELPGNVDRRRFFADGGERGFVFWIVHDDIRFPGWEQRGKLDCREIPGVDCVINGHIHKTFREVVDGETTWINPGNIVRLDRSEDCRRHEPAVLRIDIGLGGWKPKRVAVPYEQFESVFHERFDGFVPPDDESAFVKGLEELQKVRTLGGEGLQAFLEKNLGQFSEPVANEIRILAREVLNNDGNSGERDSGL
jgi:hypothetical protein